MDRAAIGTAARVHLNALGTDYVTGTVLVGAIDRACRRLNSFTKYNRADATISLVAGVREYSLDTRGILDVYRVRIGDAKTRLDPTSIAALDNDNPGWESATNGTPTRYYTDGAFIGFVNAPHGTAAGTTVYVRGLKQVSPLATATAVPSWCPIAFQDAIPKGAALEIMNGFDAGGENSPQRVGMLYKEWLEDANELKKLADNRSAEYQPHVRVTGYKAYRR